MVQCGDLVQRQATAEVRSSEDSKSCDSLQSSARRPRGWRRRSPSGGSRKRAPPGLGPALRSAKCR